MTPRGHQKWETAYLFILLLKMPGPDQMLSGSYNSMRVEFVKCVVDLLEDMTSIT